MDQRYHNRSVLIVSIALVLVVALVLILVLVQPQGKSEGIILPAAQTETLAESVPNAVHQDEFLKITTDNVASALRSLERPTHYNQRYEVAVGVNELRSTRTVELWVSNTLIHAEIRSDFSVKSVLTDGQTAWIWYDSEPNPISFSLRNSITTEDLLGIPGFDYLNTLDTLTVLESDYLLLQEPQLQSIYVCARSSEEETNRWWINLDNGLMVRADAQERNQMVYEVRQTYFARLAEGDESFSGRFVLPNGDAPFTASAETQQPSP